MNGFLWRYAFKDLFRKKTRNILGILGVFVSLFLLTTVSFLTDSISNSYIDFLTADSGDQDIVLNARHYIGEPENYSMEFKYSPIIEALQNDENVSSEIAHYIPRSSFWVATQGSLSNPEENFGWFQLSVLDIKAEESINFGQFTNLEENFDVSQGIPENHCLISLEFAQRYELNPGDQLDLWLWFLNNTVRFTVTSSFDQIYKFPLGEEKDIVIDYDWWGNLANSNDNTENPLKDWGERSNKLIFLIEDSDKIYDVRDITGSEDHIVNIGAKILKVLGFNPWELKYPKLNLLFISEYLTLSMNIVFMMVGFISTLISAILINGILSTSVEEKIREFGINRVLGARKKYNVQLILIQASIICTIGTTLGIISSLIFTSKFLVPFLNIKLVQNNVPSVISFVIQPTTILISYAIGIGVSMIVSILPAIKVSRISLVESINPYRHTEEIYKLEKEGAANVKLIFLGIVLALNGGFLYFIIPKVLISLEFSILVNILIGTLLFFLIGISLMAIGLMPLFIRLLIRVFEPFSRKLMNIVKVSVYRHQRRNLSTIVMFVLAFSFIIYVSSMLEIQFEQVGGLIQYDEGSDIVVRPRNYDISAPTSELQRELLKVEGIERTSTLLASTSDLENIYSEEQKEFNVELGDYINYNSAGVYLFGVDENYKDTVWDPKYIELSEGNKDNAFEEVFNNLEINIIISASLASELKIHLDDSARLTFTRGTEEEPYIVNIVGVAKSMPGLKFRFREAGIGLGGMSNGGVLMSNVNYLKCMNIPGDEDAFIDQIFVKVSENYNHTLVGEDIKHTLGGEYNLRVRVTNEDIMEAEKAFLTVKYLFLLILIGSVFIALFGLISSSYSSILERSREIGIIRVLGLHPHEVDKMFILENLILMLASASSGGFIGFVTAVGLSGNLTIFTQTPRMIAIPWDIIAIIYAISLIALILGMKWLMRKIRTKNIIKIFRDTL
ncbi:ABC transporter permease [Promethearchaeum syntrophicum]|uniref:ABC transporter permease n=1 Tax=Promethearchaeum syntrophicum TaxID=2594042 RepID=A0A5B9DAD2_9ARCH|nr:ABC transporter permease [Candidatus Prometheoarchaeum syntrophicum]QEE15905.1 macrolide transporter ATP-binding /permease protein [Candidatus Prometheoarchaeum syntrophicum]